MPRLHKLVTRRSEVRRTYDLIAPHFSETRRKPWPEVERFLEGRSGRVALDLGTGNGRHAELLCDRVDRVLAVDFSRTALNLARSRGAGRGYEFAAIEADVVSLPVRSGSVDVGVFIATLHHLPSRTLRVASLAELDRVLSNGGAAIVSAWSVSHDRFDAEEGFDTTVGWTLPDGQVIDRYYHIYDRKEFEADLSGSGLEVVSVFESAGNCFGTVTTGRA